MNELKTQKSKENSRNSKDISRERENVIAPSTFPHVLQNVFIPGGGISDMWKCFAFLK